MEIIPSMLPVMQMGTRRPRGCQLGLTPFPSILPLLVGCSGLTSCQGAGLAQETTGSPATGCAAPRYSAGRPRVCALLCLVPPSQINNIPLFTVSTSVPVLLILHPSSVILAQMPLAHCKSLSVSFPGGCPCTFHRAC